MDDLLFRNIWVFSVRPFWRHRNSDKIYIDKILKKYCFLFINAMNAYRLHHNRSSGGAATMFDDLDSFEWWNRHALFAPECCRLVGSPSTVAYATR